RTSSTLSYLSYINNCIAHSFPTRRSSDLGGLIESLVARVRIRTVEREARQERPAGLEPVGTGARGLDGRLHGGRMVLDRETERIDRKSTRLNSSHVKISYAVFCLKKKKTH